MWERGLDELWFDPVGDFFDTYPEHRDYIVNRVKVIEPDKDTNLICWRRGEKA